MPHPASADAAPVRRGRHFLFVPGPTNVPDRVLRAMHRPMEDHRSSAFPELTRSILPRLRPIFGTTSGETFVFPASGTGMWEAALMNTLSPGDRVLAVRFGQFSHLFIDAARRLGFTVDVIEAPWGEGAPDALIEEALAVDTAHEIKGVLVVHNETSTGVTSDIGGVRAAMDRAKHPALLYVDGVSSVGSLEFRMDEWRVDLAITGSQKGFMLPAGLGILCVSERAVAASEHATSPRSYFDWQSMRAQNAAGYFPYTPALSLLFGLRESLDMLEEEGLPNVWARHARLAEGVRRAVHAWGLSLCARSARVASDTVSTIVVPDGANAASVIDIAYRRYDLALGTGLGQLGGRVFRIGHMGDLNELMLVGALGGAEMSMLDAGISVTAGSGVAAAMEFWRANPQRVSAAR
jgi:alanine-glyoxylate transaminase/serine-glyoxylate transaminase/serine-pyruvate transaminase